MPFKHTRTFRVRHYECDSYGHLNNTNYLRYMQETAFDASAAVGYPYHYYFDSGSIWIIRQTYIHFIRPLAYNEEVDVTTWIDDMRKVRSTRMYDFRLRAGGDPVASAFSEWAFVNLETLRPTPIPESMIEGFMRDTPSSQPASKARFPEPPLLPEEPFTVTRTVEWQDVDTMRHVNNAVYMAYMQEAGVQAPAAFGWPVTRIIDEGKVALVARKNHILYQDSARLGDVLAITTYLSDVRHASALRHFTIVRPSDNAGIAKGRIEWVAVDLETGRPSRIPPAMIEDFAGHISR